MPDHTYSSDEIEGLVQGKVERPMGLYDDIDSDARVYINDLEIAVIDLRAIVQQQARELEQERGLLGRSLQFFMWQTCSHIETCGCGICLVKRDVNDWLKTHPNAGKSSKGD